MKNMKTPLAIALTFLIACCLLPGSLVAAEDADTAAADTREGVVLEHFNDVQASMKRWMTVNDGVMGCKSKGGPSFENGVMAFAGAINTDGGGFSSVRTRPSDHDLTGTTGLLLRVKGDGRTYEASIRTDAKLGRWWVPFRAEFETVKDEWVTVFVPYEAMTPSIMGRAIRDNPPTLELDKVQSFGIMLADGKDGPFELQVDWIKAGDAERDAETASE